MAKPRQWVQWLSLPVWVVSLLMLGWLGLAYMPQGSPEDYTAYRIAQNGDMAANLWQHYALELDREREEANRLRPLYTFVMTVWMRYVGVEWLELWNALMFALMGLTAWLLQRWLQTLGIGLWAALMGATLMVVGAQMEAAQLYLYQEVPALCLTALSLLLLRKNWMLSLLALLMAGATKEGYLLLLPAWCALHLWLGGQHPTRRQWLVVALVLLYLLAMLLYIRATVSTTHAGMYGFSAQKSTPLRMLVALGQLLTQNGYVPLFLLAIVGVSIFFLWYKNKKRPSRITLLLVGMAAYVILSQVVLYALSGFLFPRYWLPANVGLGLLLALGLRHLSIHVALKAGLLVMSFLVLASIGWWHLLRWGNYAWEMENQARQLEATRGPLLLLTDCTSASYELPWWLLRLEHRHPEVRILSDAGCTSQDRADMRGVAKHVHLRYYKGDYTPASVLMIGSMLGRREALPLLQKEADTLCKKWNLRYGRPHEVGNPLWYVYPEFPPIYLYWLRPPGNQTYHHDVYHDDD